MRKIDSLKSQDIAIVLKLISTKNDNWKQAEIANELKLSQGEIAKSLARLKKSGFILDRRINRSAVLEFLIHGVKYAFPANVGSLVIGVPTASSSPLFDDKILKDQQDIFVWPCSKGNVRGQSVTTFYPQQAESALNDQIFYELLALVDTLRIGRARERKLAESALKERIKN